MDYPLLSPSQVLVLGHSGELGHSFVSDQLFAVKQVQPKTTMNVPMQARPIMRSVSSARISNARMSGITASDCNSECGWAMGACAASIPLGPNAVAGCLISVGATSCRDCIGELMGGSAEIFKQEGGYVMSIG